MTFPHPLRRPRVLGMLAILALAACAPNGGSEQVAKEGQRVGNFPVRTTAPYLPTYTSTIDGASDLTALSNATGNRFWTLAFVINDDSAYCTPTFNGWGGLDNAWATSIADLRSHGGDVILSLGGYGGRELGYSCGSVAELQKAYQSVIDAYGLRSLDFDIEDGDTVKDAVEQTAANHRRNQALANLQAANPGLQISYTLGVSASGLPDGQLTVVTDAASTGVSVSVVNVMAMDYGTCNENMGQDAIAAAKNTRDQLAANGISAAVGVTPMIGTNDTKCEVFSTVDAQNLVNYAQANPFIARLAYWAQDADSSTYGDAYVHIFEGFTGGAAGGACTENTYPNAASPWLIPGSIEAENYDTCGEGVGYQDTTPGNTGGAYRQDDVDIETTSDTGGGHDVGYIASGEWLAYTMKVTVSGSYAVEVRVAEEAAETMHVEVDGANVTGSIALPNTGGWQTWTTVTSASFSLAAGTHVVRAVFDSGGNNLNWLRFDALGGSAGGCP